MVVGFPGSAGASPVVLPLHLPGVSALVVAERAAHHRYQRTALDLARPNCNDVGSRRSAGGLRTPPPTRSTRELTLPHAGESCKMKRSEALRALQRTEPTDQATAIRQEPVPGRAGGDPGGGARQPRLPARAVRVIKDSDAHVRFTFHHARSGLLVDLRLHRRRPGHGVRGGAGRTGPGAGEPPWLSALPRMGQSSSTDHCGWAETVAYRHCFRPSHACRTEFCRN